MDGEATDTSTAASHGPGTDDLRAADSPERAAACSRWPCVITRIYEVFPLRCPAFDPAEPDPGPDNEDLAKEMVARAELLTPKAGVSVLAIKLWMEQMKGLASQTPAGRRKALSNWYYAFQEEGVVSGRADDMDAFVGLDGVGSQKQEPQVAGGREDEVRHNEASQVNNSALCSYELPTELFNAMGVLGSQLSYGWSTQEE